MRNSDDSAEVYRSKIQRTPASAVFGVCLMISADDLAFVDSGTEWLRIKKTRTENKLIIEIGGQAP